MVSKMQTFLWEAEVTIQMLKDLAITCTDISKTRSSAIVKIGSPKHIKNDGTIMFDIAKRMKGFLVQRAVDAVGGVTVDRIRHALTVRAEPVVIGTVKDLVGADKKNPNLQLPKGYPTPLAEFGLKKDGTSFQTYWWELDVKNRELTTTIKCWAKGVEPELIEKLLSFGYIGDRHGRLTIGEFELAKFNTTKKELIIG